jgi:SAM-dependent methyltransferase/general stress protein CsbA
MDPFYSQLLVTITLIILAVLFTVIAFDTWQTVLLMILFLIGMNYLIILSLDRLTTINYGSISEGFVTHAAHEKAESDAALSKYEWLGNDDLFDDFYASIFTKLTQNENLIQAETAICMEEFTKDTPKDQLNILDAGCGIGIAACALAKQGAGQVVGIDKSQAMIRYAKGTTLPSTTLTETERQNVEFRMFDLMGPGAAGAAEFTNACMLYFTIYYFKDLDMLFRNLALWVKPGGSLAIEVVNKYKFDPVLDSSNPWVGVSPQNYVKERLKTSKVVFDKFDYEATFELEDPEAEFRETFRFKDGSIRRQKHALTMPSMSEIIKKAQRNGWMYSSYVDLMPLSFQYGYLLFFKRMSE